MDVPSDRFISIRDPRIGWMGACFKGVKPSLVLAFLASVLSGCRSSNHQTISVMPVSVSISPSSASVQAGRSQQFTAAVSGTTNTAVNWLVAGILGGNSSVGTIASTGLYTAPSSVSTNPVIVTAQSAYASTSSANATITITSTSSFVPENLETALIWVDPNGSDSNPGTQSQPLKTIQHAADLAYHNNQNNIGSRVTINPGTYREQAYYDGNSSSTSAPVTFQAATNGTVFIKGSDIYTGWVASGNVFTHSFVSLGQCALPGGWPTMWPILLRREMVFVNGTPLTQVISSGQLVVGTFYVDDANHVISIWPPSGTDMSTATVEVAVRPAVFHVDSISNVVLRGLVFQHAATCPQGGAGLLVNTSDHVLIDTDQFLWNNQSGLGFWRTSNVVMQNSIVNHNGGAGWGATQGTNVTATTNETSYNNWRNAMGAYYGWAYAGAKLLSLHGADFNGWKSYYNQTGGGWFDTDNANITIENLDSSNNLSYGMFLEANEGPISITSSKFCNNWDNSLPTSSFGTLLSGNSEFVTVSSTLFYNNAVLAGGGGQIEIAGTSAGRPVTNWETGQAYNVQSQNWTLSNDTIVGVGSLQNLFYSYVTGSVWTLFTSTFSSNNNAWWNASNASVFHVSTGTYNFAGWKSALGQDANSTFSDPGVSCPAPIPDQVDYWLTTYSDGNVQTVSRGASASYTIQVFPVGAFSGTVSFSVDGVTQIGATSNFGSTSITGSGSTTLTINTSGGTSTGTFPITVIASSGGVVRTVTLTLTVQ